jgi:hypothetical protein
VIDHDWLDRPYVSRISAASAAALRPFLDSYNAGRPFADQVKPFNFLICVHAATFSHPAGYPPERFQLVHPFEPDPQRWLELEWIDHYSGDRFPIHTLGPPSPDSVKVKTNRDVLNRYRTHPEPKASTPTANHATGSAPASSNAARSSQPRSATSAKSQTGSKRPSPASSTTPPKSSTATATPTSTPGAPSSSPHSASSTPAKSPNEQTSTGVPSNAS